MPDYATAAMVSSMGEELEREITSLKDRIAFLEGTLSRHVCPEDCGCDSNAAYLRGVEDGEEMQRETPAGRA